MRTIFYAMGPSFKPNHIHQWIKLVDEYLIVSEAAGVVPEAGHHGDWGRVRGMFA